MAGKGKKCVVKRKSSSKKGARRQPVSKMKTAKKLKKPGGARGAY
tara:strand:- start:8032 stop:8166 length:135 start_codon:yes stop_codon:yes gene_type:complete